MVRSSFSSLLALVAIASANTIAQAPLGQVFTCTTVADYGYKGPGFYQIISLESPAKVAVTPGDTTTDTALVAQSPDTSNYAQSWLFADVGNGSVTIANNVTGAILTGYGERNTTHAISTPPYDKRGIWKMDNSTWSSFSGNPVILINAGVPYVLDLADRSTAPGNKIITFHLKGGGTSTDNNNQAWLLQFLGYPA